MNKKVLLLVGLLIVVLIGISIFVNNNEKNDDQDLNIYFFEAGKADSAIIYNEEFAVLIDTGEKELGDTILDYLNKQGIKKLDYLIITHFDKDHVGSASKIINNIEIGKVIQSNYPKESNVYTKYLESLEQKKITPITLRDNLYLNLGEVQFNIIPPEEEEYSEKPSNNSSLIVSVKYKDNKFLFMGDAENLRIAEYLKTHTDEYNLIKVPYHGHYQVELNSLINIVNPNYAVITSSNEEMEDTETLKILKNNNVIYYVTREGSILVTSDGTNINIKQ